MFCTLLANAQKKCGTVEYQELLQKNHPKKESPEQFEYWMQNQILVKQQVKPGLNRNEDAIVVIPVVVHIVHNGEAIGVGRNLSVAQIISQIEVLNEDFRRLNNDKTNTPPAFQPVAADIEIEFVLASRDPEGLPTDGIVRVNGNREVWGLIDNKILKSLSYWPAEDYLNIWVTDLGSDYLGYAQFPVSTLSGLDNSSNNALTDGVAIDFITFGSKAKVPNANIHPSYDLGRTATHEIGHFFGLRHIWGDGGCSIDDFCNDTPVARKDHNSLSDCTFPGPNTCNNDLPDLPDMFQNYMDYTNDVCMNLFTQDQKTRMRVVLDSSPRRTSLATSNGGIPPIMVANDAGIRNVISPVDIICGSSFTPEIEIRNYGTNNISGVSIALKINDAVIQTANPNLNLALLELATVVFDDILINSSGELDLTFEILSVNGVADGNSENNIATTKVTVPEASNIPLRVNFDNLPTDWTIENFDELLTWELIPAPNGEANNMALSVQFYHYDNEGETDYLSSPVFDLSDQTTARLSFDVAYSRYPGITDEGLLVTISENCVGALADTIYFKTVDDLKTISSTSSDFIPTSSADWRKEIIDLAPYLGFEALQIRFIAKNGYGNNLYIDNISVDNVKNRIISPSPSSCNPAQELQVEVVNNGVTPITAIDISYRVDEDNLTTQTFNLSEPLQPGFSTLINAPLANLSLGEHNLVVIIDLPNIVENSFLTHNFYVDQAVDFIPLKESFDDFQASTWKVANHDQGITWETLSNGDGGFLFINESSNLNLNDEDWLISPSIDFNNATDAALAFNIAYSNISNAKEALKLYISTDCGETFELSDYNKLGTELTTGTFDDDPSGNWRQESVDLSDYLGYDEVRLALVATNQNGSNIYVDDIQIYVTKFFSESENVLFPNPTINGIFGLAFDLKKREQVRVLVYDISGNLLFEKSYDNTLNHYYEFDLSHQPQGIYIVKAVGESFTLLKRVMKSD